METDLYDEFGNYIGPELDSDEDEDVEADDREAAEVQILIRTISLNKLVLSFLRKLNL